MNIIYHFSSYPLWNFTSTKS